MIETRAVVTVKQQHSVNNNQAADIGMPQSTMTRFVDMLLAGGLSTVRPAPL